MAAYATIPTANTGELRVVIREKMAKASDSDDRTACAERLKKVFEEVMASGQNTSSFKTCVVTWVDKPVEKLENKDILIYVVRTINDSLLNQAYPNLAQQLAKLTADEKKLLCGTTTAGVNPTFSEIYWDADYCQTTARVANVMFHECLHNKLDMGTSMHDLAPMVGNGGGFIQGSLPSIDNLALTSVDKSQMGGKLGTDRPQKVKI